MLRIIDGKRYNTETATVVADVGNGMSNRDFRFDRTKLYQTKKGAWFIAGHGGAMSRWAQSTGDGGRCGGEGIRLVTADEARQMLERWNESAALEKYFELADG